MKGKNEKMKNSRVKKEARRMKEEKIEGKVERGARFLPISLAKNKRGRFQH